MGTISDLTELTTPAVGDFLMVRDISDASNKDKKIAISNLAIIGSWTPVLRFGGASVGITYSVQQAAYAQIGGLYYVTARLALSNKGSSTGIADISGVPASPAHQLIASVYYTGMATNWVNMIALTAGTTLILRGAQAAGTGNSTSVTNTDFNNSSEIRINAVFIA